MRIVLALGLLLGLGATAVSTDAARPLGSQGQASAVKRSADRAITAQGTVVYEQIASVMRVALKIAALDGAGARFLTPLAHPGEVRADCCASFSPDGQLVAFFRQFRTGRALEMIAASGGPSHPLITQARATQLSGQRARLGDVVWTPDGKRLAVGVAAGTQACGGEGVLAVNADGTNARWLVPLSFAPTRTLLYLGAWSPNGDQILVIAESNDGDCYLGHEGTSRLLIAHDGPGGRPHSILKSNHMRDPVWSPDGSRIALETECGQVCNIVTLDPSGQAVRTLTHFRTAPDFIGAALAWRNPDDDLLVLHGNKLFTLSGASGRPGTFAYTLPCNPSCPDSKILGSLDGSVAGFVLNNFFSGKSRLTLIALSGAGARSLAIPLTTDDIWLD